MACKGESMWRTNRHIDNEWFITRLCVCLRRKIAVDSAVYLHFFAIDEVPRISIFSLSFLNMTFYGAKSDDDTRTSYFTQTQEKKVVYIHFHFSVYRSRGRKIETSGDGSRDKKKTK